MMLSLVSENLINLFCEKNISGSMTSFEEKLRWRTTLESVPVYTMDPLSVPVECDYESATVLFQENDVRLSQLSTKVISEFFIPFHGAFTRDINV